MEYLIGLMLTIVFLVFIVCRQLFKISYYECKLENRSVDISKVKNMAFWKLWID